MYAIRSYYDYWGDASGPFHPTLNPGGQGDAVSDEVVFAPWLNAPECVAPVTGLQANNDGPKVETVPVQLTASIASGTGVTYAWDLGDGTTAQGASVSHLYDSGCFRCHDGEHFTEDGEMIRRDCSYNFV